MALTNPYIIALRSGNIGLATALSNPQTKQSYSGKKSTVNLKTFVKEAGYTIENHGSIPNSIFSGSSTKSAARTAAEMISVSENTKVMPSYDAQSQKFNNSISNNNVNPAALYTPQPVNTNGNSQNSSVSGGINANANYNYATQMNDFQNSNPTGQVNMGQAPQGWGYTGGKSSIPFENEVKTSLLGGDIQHQESEINTNVGYLPEMNDPQDTVKKVAIGGVGIAGVGIGALLLKKMGLL